MKWLFSVRKATHRLLGSQLDRLHGSSRGRFSHTVDTIMWSKYNHLLSSSSMSSSHHYSTSKALHTNEFSYRFTNGSENEKNIKKGDLEIISRERIKPATPTPRHLRTFKLSIIDQLMVDLYTPIIVFLPNTDKASLTDVIAKRSKHLKEGLSQILTQFYPFAGQVVDNLHIECNDEGVYFLETQVSQTLKDFLCDPDDHKVRDLMPESPRTEESSVRNFVLGVQVNIFSCGGIGLCLSASHKIIDGHTCFMFFKAWAEAARGSPQTVSPIFLASEIFPNNPSLEYSVPSKLLTGTKMFSTKRFLFDSTALALLKAQPVACSSSSRAPTRTEATTAIIWKAAANAASTIRPFSPQSPYALLSSVNLRNRASPPLSNEYIGNLINSAVAICFPESKPDLPTLISLLRESIVKIDADDIESMKWKKGHEKFNENLRNLNHLANVTQEGDCMFASSVLNSGMYELDFGWGKPIWFYTMNAGYCRLLHLNDTLKGGGVEAIVTLSPKEMEIFERDPELLSYATLNPSPGLQLVKH